jgi:hypothetical protein
LPTDSQDDVMSLNSPDRNGRPRRGTRKGIVMGAGVGMIFGAALGDPGVGLVLGAGLGLVVGAAHDRRGHDPSNSR